MQKSVEAIMAMFQLISTSISLNVLLFFNEGSTQKMLILIEKLVISFWVTLLRMHCDVNGIRIHSSNGISISRALSLSCETREDVVDELECNRRRCQEGFQFTLSRSI
jgi:hypothetical protein